MFCELGAETRSRQHIAVNDVRWNFAASDGQRAFTVDAPHVAKQLRRPSYGMRRKNDVVEAYELGIRLKRFSLEYIQRRAAYAPILAPQ